MSASDHRCRDGTQTLLDLLRAAGANLRALDGVQEELVVPSRRRMAKEHLVAEAHCGLEFRHPLEYRRGQPRVRVLVREAALGRAEIEKVALVIACELQPGLRHQI